MTKIRSWDQLKTIAAVARFGSYRKAARELSMSVSTVARHVEHVEQELLTPIFKLEGGRWSLTPIGRQLESVAKATQSMIALIDSSVSSSEGYNGNLKLTTLSYVANNFLAPKIDHWW